MDDFSCHSVLASKNTDQMWGKTADRENKTSQCNTIWSLTPAISNRYYTELLYPSPPTMQQRTQRGLGQSGSRTVMFSLKPLRGPAHENRQRHGDKAPRFRCHYATTFTHMRRAVHPTGYKQTSTQQAGPQGYLQTANLARQSLNIDSQNRDAGAITAWLVSELKLY